MKVLKDTGAKGLNYPSYLLINYQKVGGVKLSKTKSFCISKKSVMAAWEKVKDNKGTYGVDLESITDFESNLKDNLYKMCKAYSFFLLIHLNFMEDYCL